MPGSHVTGLLRLHLMLACVYMQYLWCKVLLPQEAGSCLPEYAACPRHKKTRVGQRSQVQALFSQHDISNGSVMLVVATIGPRPASHNLCFHRLPYYSEYMHESSHR